MVHRKSEYRLNFRWLPVEVCRDTRVASAEYRTNRRRADLAHTDFLAWSGAGAGFGADDCSPQQSCECNAIDFGERHLPATKNRQLHDRLLEQWARCHRQQIDDDHRQASTDIRAQPQPTKVTATILTKTEVPSSARSQAADPKLCPDRGGSANKIGVDGGRAVETQTDSLPPFIERRPLDDRLPSSSRVPASSVDDFNYERNRCRGDDDKCGTIDDELFASRGTPRPRFDGE